MTPCQQLQAQAAGLASLPPSDPEGARARAHAVTCPACASALAEGDRLQVLLGEVPPAPAPSEAVLRRVAAAIAAEEVRPAWHALAPAALAAAAFAVLVAGARARGDAWPLALGALAAAVGLVVLSGARTRASAWAPSLAVVTSTAIGLALLEDDGGLRAVLGAWCAVEQLAAALLPLAAALWFARRSAGWPGPQELAGVAAGGALAGQAALALTCPGHGAPHLVVFHLGAVVFAGALGRAALALVPAGRLRNRSAG